ncbi:NAD(P)H-hydrate epimerase [Oceanobacillus alkalisoli]|uniref:NAD(P)H-hydrate epimerase n=1 Tax=Oceanobacillus alkalisoli TaxID=2925113 RepID=UPI001F11A46E|nr:NAD(P)H-hydrate epimerase [Oceanobacillus alkalisoli]MCF3944645.1 NAD(P)H-hydrate epimerase [Oceanobacillus alkalisoli]
MFIVTAKEMYDIDKYTMEKIGLPGHLLMENAGREIFRNVISLVEQSERIAVFVGAGNNGGDGFVIARYLLEHVRVVQIVPDEKIGGDALLHKEIYLNSNGELLNLLEHDWKGIIKNSDVIIDSLLGIGTKGELREPYRGVVELMSATYARIVSVAIPSGLPADEAVPFSLAVKADYMFVVGVLKITACLPGTAVCIISMIFKQLFRKD